MESNETISRELAYEIERLCDLHRGNPAIAKLVEQKIGNGDELYRMSKAELERLLETISGIIN